MKKKKFNFRFRLKSKNLLIVMTFLLVSVIAAAFAAGISPEPLQEAAGFILVPFENSIAGVADLFGNIRTAMQDKRNLIAENEELKVQVETLTNQNNRLLLDQSEFDRLKSLYDLDQDYSDYPKVAAKIVACEPGNWYSTFMINMGSNDGVRVDNNVIADKGLVGIVTEVGSTWSTVRSIIDDSSSVSAMTVSGFDDCIVQGDLDLVEEGKLRFELLYDDQETVTVGERLVTSNISEKYVEGLFIGYISEIGQDSNNLTRTGTVVTPVDFQRLREVFVITLNKQDEIYQETIKSSVPEEENTETDVYYSDTIQDTAEE